MQLTLSMAIMQVTTSVAFLQVLRWYFLLLVCWWIFLLQLCKWLFLLQLRSCKFLQHICSSSFCSKYVDDNFYCNYAAGSLCCNYTGGTFCSALCTWHWQPLFIKLIRKHLKAFVNISRKLIYFEGRNDIQISCKSYSVLSFSRETYERQGHVGFLERGNLRKWGEGWSREGGGYDPPYQLWLMVMIKTMLLSITYLLS